jgi:hypothetical protein
MFILYCLKELNTRPCDKQGMQDARVNDRRWTIRSTARGRDMSADFSPQAVHCGEKDLRTTFPGTFSLYLAVGALLCAAYSGGVMSLG